MARLNARWLNFTERGQAWDHFWQDAAVTGGTLVTRTAADSVTAADAAQRALGLARSLADSVTNADAVVRTLALVRSAADAVTGSDAAARAVTLARSAADAAGLGRAVE